MTFPSLFFSLSSLSLSLSQSRRHPTILFSPAGAIRQPLSSTCWLGRLAARHRESNPQLTTLKLLERIKEQCALSTLKEIRRKPQWKKVKTTGMIKFYCALCFRGFIRKKVGTLKLWIYNFIKDKIKQQTLKNLEYPTLMNSFFLSFPTSNFSRVSKLIHRRGVATNSKDHWEVLVKELEVLE